MTPRPRGSITRAAACAQKNAPLRFVSMVSRQSSSGSASDGPIIEVPALLTRMSSRFHPLSAASANISAVDRSRTSPAMPMASCPSLCRSRTTRSARSCDRALTTILAPSRAYAQAIASPMPMLEPVTMAT